MTLNTAFVRPPKGYQQDFVRRPISWASTLRRILPLYKNYVKNVHITGNTTEATEELENNLCSPDFNFTSESPKNFLSFLNKTALVPAL